VPAPPTPPPAVDHAQLLKAAQSDWESRYAELRGHIDERLDERAAEETELKVRVRSLERAIRQMQAQRAAEVSLKLLTTDD
jgi:hypothetical protein